MWSVGASLLRGSRELSARVVCRVKYGEWVKGIVGECGLSGQVWRVGQRNCRQSLVCRGEKGEWVKGIGDGVWSVGTSMASGSRELSAVWSVGTSLASGSKELSLACGLSAQVCCVGQGDCRRVWSVGTSMASGSKELSTECGLSGRKRRVNQRNHTYRMPQTSQIATQIKIAKTLKT